MRIVFLACLLAFHGTQALAQSFPSRPLSVVCPFPQTGGATDQYMRALAAAASRHLGQPVGIEYKPGGVGTLGPAAMAAAARPDGYSLAMLPVTAFRVPHMQRVSWDPLKDFTYVIGLARLTFGVVVKSDSPFKTLKDLIDFAKANPGKLRYGAPEYGTSPHLAMEELAIKNGVKLQALLELSGAVAHKALMDGQVLALSDASSWGSHVNSGAFRLLVTFGERRSSWNAPTALELGLDILSYSPFGIVGPKGMDPARTKILHDAFNKALDEPEYATLLSRLDMVDWYKSSEDYAEWAVDQFRFQRTLVQRILGSGGR